MKKLTYTAINPHNPNCKQIRTYKLDYNVGFFRKKSAAYYYFLGIALTDGCISYQSGGRNDLSFTLGSKDYEWLETLHSLIGGSIQYREKQGKCNALRLFNKEINEILLADGCVPRKTLTLRLPTIPDKYFMDFLRGCIDGDGCIQLSNQTKNPLRKNANIYLCSASKSFITAINAILIARFGLKPSFFIAAKKGDTSATFAYTKNLYRISLGGSNAYKLIKLLDYEHSDIALQRKKEVAASIIHYYEHLPPTTYHQGELSPGAKLTEKKVRAIRKKFSAGGITCAQLARDYKMSHDAVTAILTRKTWKHVV